VKIILETHRLKLGEFLEMDAENMFQLNKDPELVRYTGKDPFSSVEEAQSFFLQYDHYKKFGYGRWVISLKDTNEYVGWCGELVIPLTRRKQTLDFVWLSAGRAKKNYWPGNER
jgi:ribosomal-protein-alanine N-acetyltransferase